MTRGDTVTTPVVRRTSRNAERLRDGVTATQRFEDIIDRRVLQQHGADNVRLSNGTQALRQESLRGDFDPSGENDPPMVRDLRQEVANRLVMIRAELKLSQTAMAQYLNVDRLRYWHWEGFATNKPPRGKKAAEAAKPAAKAKKGKAAPPEPEEQQGNLPAIDVMILLSEKTGITLDYIYKGDPSGLSMAMAIRLEARAQGLDPDAPEFQTPAGKAVLRAKTGV
jgi:transcriptional regulator with XRE-family HTH domain